MFNDLKLALQSFKKSWADYLSISFVFAMIVFLAILLGNLFLGLFISFIVIIIPAIISLKFCVHQAYDKPQVEYKSFKLGFLTFFKSIKVYLIVILKPLLIGFLVGIFVYSLFLEKAINVASETMPNIMEALVDYDTFYYTYEDMLKIKEVKKIIDLGTLVSLSIGGVLFLGLKLKRDFIPFIAFEMPINSKRAIVMNGKMLEKKNYLKFLLVNCVVFALFAIPLVLSWLTKRGLQANDTFSPTTISLIMTLVFLLVSSPIIVFQQLHYVYAYKSYSKPLKEDFNNELQNVIKEIEELTKKIDKNNEK